MRNGVIWSIPAFILKSSLTGSRQNFEAATDVAAFRVGQDSKSPGWVGGSCTKPGSVSWRGSAVPCSLSFSPNSCPESRSSLPIMSHLSTPTIRVPRETTLPSFLGRVVTVENYRLHPLLVFRERVGPVARQRGSLPDLRFCMMPWFR